MRVVACLVVLALTAACSSAVAPPVVVDATNTRAPYAGPMQLPVLTDDETAPVLDRTGAAGRALECDGKPYDGDIGAGYVDDTNRVQPSAVEAVEHWNIDNGAPDYKPPTGFRTERRDAQRVLFSWDVAGRTKFAIIVANGRTDHFHRTGWGVETWAECDPAEFPAAITDAMGLGIWTDRNGHRVPIAEVVSFSDDNWCGVDSARLMDVGGPALRNAFVHDPGHHLTTESATLDAVPRTATDTGFHRGGRELWTSPGGAAVYLVATDDPTDVEQWPHIDSSCAG